MKFKSFYREELDYDGGIEWSLPVGDRPGDWVAAPTTYFEGAAVLRALDPIIFEVEDAAIRQRRYGTYTKTDGPVRLVRMLPWTQQKARGLAIAVADRAASRLGLGIKALAADSEGSREYWDQQTPGLGWEDDSKQASALAVRHARGAVLASRFKEDFEAAKAAVMEAADSAAWFEVARAAAPNVEIYMAARNAELAAIYVMFLHEAELWTPKEQEAKA